MSLNFEDLTIGQLRTLTAEYEELKKENKILKRKYPTKLKEKKEDPQTTQDLIDSLPQ